jgi:hypothetical protein
VQRLPEDLCIGIALRGVRNEPTDPIDFPRQLCVSDDWRPEDAEGEAKEEPGGDKPHGCSL